MLRKFLSGSSPSVLRCAQDTSWWLSVYFLWLMAYFLLPSFPTYEQNTAIHQRGRNRIQSYNASTHVLSQMIRNCLHSLCTPHVRGTGTLTPAHIHVSHITKRGSGSWHRDLHTGPLLPCHGSEEGSNALRSREVPDPLQTDVVNDDVILSSK